MNLYESITKNRFLISGPCIIENEDMVFDLAQSISKIAEELGFVYIFKASFDKANRTSGESFRGNGLEYGLEILKEVKKRYNLSITTDVHETTQVEKIAEVVDILQIPAFLCRQTDLLVACGSTNKIVNVKKAQFIAGDDMKYVVKKIESTHNQQIILTERGTMFGYGNLVVDFRNIVDMKKLGYPVCMDVTHSLQKPGSLSGKTGADREYAPYIARAAAAVGVDGFFFEVHQNPDIALSDSASMIPLAEFKNILVSSVTPFMKK
ncbi:MAG: 3-deoxy-8-phosphooctulonate synthase [Chitinophagaceae bacterium]|nr:3-deoxy-8-phosphooctulonate synthase [Chitinophagaceae bacterium]